MKQRDLLIGIGLIVLGLLFLVGPSLDLAQVGWPFFVIVPGAALLFLAFSMPGTNSGLAIPGAVLTTIGLILLIFSLNGHWQGWAYAWALIVAASGLGTYIQGNLSDNAQLRSSGMRTAIYGVAGFVILGLFFEFLIFGSRSSFVRWLLPIGLIIAGAIMLYLNTRNRSSGAPQVTAPTQPTTRTTSTSVTPPPKRDQEHG
mgnify:FL=1